MLPEYMGMIPAFHAWAGKKWDKRTVPLSQENRPLVPRGCNGSVHAATLTT